MDLRSREAGWLVDTQLSVYFVAIVFYPCVCPKRVVHPFHRYYCCCCLLLSTLVAQNSTCLQIYLTLKSQVFLYPHCSSAEQSTKRVKSYLVPDISTTKNVGAQRGFSFQAALDGDDNEEIAQQAGGRRSIVSQCSPCCVRT